MSYEIDFIGVGSEVKQDADAFCFRWVDSYGKDGNPLYKIGVFDGGFETHGKAMTQHLNKCYFDDANGEKPRDEKVIDFVFVSHADQDHVSGLKEILEEFNVKALYMNRPWEYVKELYEIVKGRITLKSLEKSLKTSYSNIATLEEIAEKNSIPISPAFAGDVISERLRVLSPSKDFYLTLLAESSKTPETETVFESAQKVVQKIKAYLLNILEDWNTETLHEGVTTSAENETSIVLLGQMDDETFLLTGDAGLRALSNAMDYAEKNLGIKVKDRVSFYQIPHHGGRHNVSPSILNRLVGGKVKEGSKPTKVAYVSVAKDSDHPLKVVTNAFVRRGATVYQTDGYTIWHHRGTPGRAGFTSITAVPFADTVEEWDD